MLALQMFRFNECRAAFGARFSTARVTAIGSRAVAGVLLMLGLCAPAFAQQITCPDTTGIDVFSSVFNAISGCVVESGSAGILIADTGTLVNEAGATLTNDATIETAGVLDNNAGAALTNFGLIHALKGSIINNSGTLANAGSLGNDAGANLGNSGTLLNFDNLSNDGSILSTGIFTNFVSAEITNMGSLDNALGAAFTNMGGIQSSGTITNEGTFDSSGRLANFSNGRLSNGGTFTNDASATLINSGSGSLDNALGAAFTNMGDIESTGTITNDGTFDSSGTLDNSEGGALLSFGTLTNDVGGTLTNEGSTSSIFNTGALINNGMLANTDAILTNEGTVTNNGMLDNHGLGEVDNFRIFTNAGTFNNTTFAIVRNFGTFTNTGTFNNGGTFTNAQSVLNAGTLDIQVGGVLNNLPGSTFAQTAGQTIVDGTLISASAIQLQGGTLSGNGAINGSVLNTGGIVRPGDAPGTLTIAGNYMQGSGGTLIIELGGTVHGDFSVLDVTGNAALDGTVDFTAVNGFTPTAGDDFTFLLFGTEAGDFSGIDFTNWSCPVGDTCTDVFSGNSVTLDIDGSAGGGSPTPEPSSILLLGTGLAAMLGFGANRRFRRDERA